MLEWRPTLMQGPHTFEGCALWAHVVRIDMLEWHKGGHPTRTLIDAQGYFLTKFPGHHVECNDQTFIWDGWVLLCPAAKAPLRGFIQRHPQWVHRPTWEVVPASHAKYMPTLGEMESSRV